MRGARLWQFAIIAVVLVVFGNLADVGAGREVPTLTWVAVAKAAGTLVIVLAAARWTGMTWREMGLARANSTRSALIGAATGLVLAIVSVAALNLAAQITYQPVRGETVTALLLHALVGLPLLTALPEELAFRGLLLGLAMRHLSPLKASLMVSALFAAWHVVIQAQTLALIDLAGPWTLALEWGGALSALFAGGLVFAFLRLRTQNLAGAVMAHWSFDAGLVVGLYLS